METEKTLSTAEKILSIVAKAVLILGVLGAIVGFFTVCVENKYSGSEVNWTGVAIVVSSLISIVLVWSLLSVIVELSANIRTIGKKHPYNWRKEFAIALAVGQNEKAKEILYREIFESDEYKEVLISNNDIYRQKCIDILNKKYEVYLEEIGESKFKHVEGNMIMSVFK